jgi:predicted nucleic acid-binding protein
MRALLDTDILSEILRRQNAQVMTRYVEVPRLDLTVI